MHAKYKVSIPYGSNVIVKVQVDKRQRETDKQTEYKVNCIWTKSFILINANFGIPGHGSFSMGIGIDKLYCIML